MNKSFGHKPKPKRKTGRRKQTITVQKKPKGWAGSPKKRTDRSRKGYFRQGEL